jgi:hypothetical protein
VGTERISPDNPAYRNVAPNFRQQRHQAQRKV